VARRRREAATAREVALVARDVGGVGAFCIFNFGSSGDFGNLVVAFCLYPQPDHPPPPLFHPIPPHSHPMSPHFHPRRALHRNPSHATFLVALSFVFLRVLCGKRLLVSRIGSASSAFNSGKVSGFPIVGDSMPLPPPIPIPIWRGLQRSHLNWRRVKRLYPSYSRLLCVLWWWLKVCLLAKS
jgi:hypothetical protein